MRTYLVTLAAPVWVDIPLALAFENPAAAPYDQLNYMSLLFPLLLLLHIFNICAMATSNKEVDKQNKSCFLSRLLPPST